jgi:hypothetical protein
MAEIASNVNFVEPMEPQDFSKPFSIAWRAKASLNVTEWMLLVGAEDGDWDIMSADTGERTRAAIDISDMSPLPQRIYARLRFAVYDPNRRKGNETDGEDMWYITPDPFEIHKK